MKADEPGLRELADAFATTPESSHTRATTALAFVNAGTTLSVDAYVQLLRAVLITWDARPPLLADSIASTDWLQGLLKVQT